MALANRLDDRRRRCGGRRRRHPARFACAVRLPFSSYLLEVASLTPTSRLTVVVSYILWGTGFPVATLILGVYYARLTLFKVPARAQIISKFLPLGPTGSGAFGLLQLAAVVRKLGHDDGQLGLVSGGLSADEGRIISLAVYGASMPSVLGSFRSPSSGSARS